MKKIVACMLPFCLLLQMTSCYSYILYLSHFETTQTTAQTRQPDLVYYAEIKASIEYGVALSTYTTYNGFTDGVPVSGTFRPAYRQGICRNFKGKPAVILLFMDDYESGWTADEVEAFTKKSVMPALGFLNREATLWGVELDFCVESYSTPLSGYIMDYLGVYPTVSSEAVKKDGLLHAAESLGFRSEWEFYSYFQSQYPTDDIIFVTIYNKEGRSFATRYVNAGYNYNVEYCTIYAKSSNPAQTVAHEILHLFGARDFYEEATTKEMSELAGSVYPDDIMFHTLPKWENHIRDYTAYAIGWTHEIPDVCYLDDWYVD